MSNAKNTDEQSSAKKSLSYENLVAAHIWQEMKIDSKCWS